VARPRASTRRHTTEALVTKAVSYGDADVILHLFTERLGAVSAIAHRAKRSDKLAREPLHTLQVTLDEREGRELMTLAESRLATPRLALLSSLDAMELAGGALALVRTIAPPRVVEPELWARVVALLDAPSRVALAELGLRALSIAGFGLELHACVACGAPCPSGKAALVSPERGGVVCRACGGGRLWLSGEARAAIARAGEGACGALDEGHIPRAVEIVSLALAAHGGVVDSRRWATMSSR